LILIILLSSTRRSSGHRFGVGLPNLFFSFGHVSTLPLVQTCRMEC
jgi:hypothetical protein